MSSGVRSAVLAEYAEVACSFGLDPLALLRAAKLPVASLSERDLMLPTERVCALLDASAQRSGCATFGLSLAQHRRLSDLGELGLVLRDQPTVRHIVNAVAEFVRLHNEALVYALEEDGDSVRILMEIGLGSGTAQRQFSEFVQGSAFRIFMGQFADARGKLRVCFRHPAPADLRAHIKFFGHAPLFGHDFNGFACRASLLDQRNPLADAEFSLRTRDLVAARMGSAELRRTDDVQRVVLQLLPTGRCSADQVAACLGVDRRTIHRQLAREGKTVSGVIDEVRIELSRRYVLGSSLPISEIASMCGFNSASSLVNWYRRRHGLPPGLHRRQQGKASDLQ